MFFLFAFGVWASASCYTAWRLMAPMALSAMGKFTAALAVLAFIFLPFLYWRVYRRHESSPGSKTMSWLTFLGMGALNYLCLLFLLRDAVWLAATGAAKIISVAYGETGAAGAVHAAEMDWWRTTNYVVLGMTGLILAYGVYQARRRPRVVTVRVPVAGLPQALAGLRILHISDLHAGPTIRRDFIKGVVQAANRAQADLVAFSGDVADGSVAHLRPEVAPLQELSARYGKFFVTGNHEYYSGVEPWIAEMRRLGFTVLLNQNQVVPVNGQRVLVAGVTDFGAGGILPHHHSDPDRALAGAEDVALNILLAHQPLSVVVAAQHGCQLQLSGHTHGGQFLPWQWLVPLQQPYLAGLFKHQDTWLYVNRGAGYWGPPLRIGAPSEIAIIELARE